MRFLAPLLLGTTLLVSGCAWMGFGDDEENAADTQGYTEQDFFEQIQADMKTQNWPKAAQNLEALEAQFPFGDYAEQAQLELIYVYYKMQDHEAAIAAADRFIRLHPQHPNVDYAYYLKGLAYYSQNQGFFDQFLPRDETMRDPGDTARNSFAAFNELLTKFPESSYTPDARQRMIHLRNLLARQEIHVANYYFVRGAYLAAANRGRYVVENFQQSPAVPDGLAVMAQAYHLMDMQDLSNDAAQLLAENYPQHPALDENGNFKYRTDISGGQRSLLSRLSFGLYDNRKPPGYDTRYIYNPAYRDETKEVEPEEPKRPLLHRMTFGVFE